MRISLLIKLGAASLCALFACALPGSLSKTHEIGLLPVAHFKPVSALAAPKVQEVAALELETATAAPETPAAPSPAPSDGDADKLWIYMHESGNNPAAKNSIGCFGVGQSCDNGALESRCGASYECQDNYFQSYMQQRYGSWNNAKAFWVAHLYW